MKAIHFVIICSLWGGFACSQQEHSASSALEAEDSTQETHATTALHPQKASSDSTLYTWVENLRLRDAPGSSSNVLLTLSGGSSLIDLGERSEETAEVELRGKTFHEPFIKVQKGKTVGWVYGGAVTDDVFLVAKEVLPQLNREVVKKHIADFSSAESAKELAGLYRRVDEMSEKLQKPLSNLMDRHYKIMEESNYQYIPDTEWIDELAPGLVVWSVAEGTEYAALTDYNQWEERAKSTSSKADDRYFSFMKDLCPGGVDHYFRNYFEQTWDYGGESLLGDGHHVEAVKTIYAHLEQDKMFETEYLAELDLLMKDIMEPMGADGVYRNPPAKMKAEIEQIIEVPQLSQSYKQQLQDRLAKL